MFLNYTEIMEEKTQVWIEKYRPIHFNDIVLDKYNRQFFENILKTNYFPNLLFYGPPGTGKTTTIINLINEFQKRYTVSKHPMFLKSNILHLNASDERGIDIIRTQINQFINTKSLFSDGLKFVILDEVDSMTKNAQQALKYLMQTSDRSVRICQICNYISKIDLSLQHEFVTVRFNQLPKKEVFSFLSNIVEKENLLISKNTLEKIVVMYDNDLRSMVNAIQSNHHILVDEKITHILSNSVWDKLHNLLSLPSSNDNDIHPAIYYMNDICQLYSISVSDIIKKYIHYCITEGDEKYMQKKCLDSMEFFMHSYMSIPEHYLALYFVELMSSYH